VLVAVVADTHMPRGGRRLPAACVERLRTADVILHAGDFAAESVFEELAMLGPPLHAVHGNVDEPALCERLPASVVVEVGELRVGMTHDPGPRAGREQRLVARFPGCAAVVYGHTHEPQVSRAGETWILNPGSPTERRRAAFHSMLVLEVSDDRLTPDLIRLS
jgi:hypothetical protein